MNVVNISGYKFVELDKLPTLQAKLKGLCLRHKLKGTILLATEGVNLMLSSSREQIDAFKKEFCAADEHFSDFWFKESFSDEIAFKRMIVKIRKEIVTMGVEHIQPLEKTASNITPEAFKKWCDENKDMIVLDTRNDFEVEAGAFDNSIHLNIKNFRDFPKAIEQLDDETKAKPIVTFCTGGIRCEKASAYMLEKGFKEVYQLQGGIIHYLEQYGGEHYHGTCFVFDDRIELDSELAVNA